MFSNSYFYLIILVCIYFCNASWLHSTNPNNTNRIEIKTVRYVHSKKFISPSDSLLFPISLDSKQLDNCNLKSFPPYPNGSVILGVAYGGCDFSRHVLLAQQNLNASAMILVTGFRDTDALLINGDFSKIEIPLFLIDEQTAITISKVLVQNFENNSLTIISLQESRNEYLRLTKNGGFIFFQVLLMSFLVFCFVMCVIGLYHSFKQSRKILTIQKICLFNNLIFHIFLFLSLLDPWGTHTYLTFNFVNVTNILLGPSLSICLSLITFFLNELLIQKKMIEARLDKFKYPFLFLAIVLWATYISFAVTFSIYLPILSLAKSLGIIILVFMVSMLIYFVTIGVIILNKLSTFKSKRIKKIFPLVVLQTLGLIFLVVFSCLLNTLYHSKSYNASLFLACWIFLWIGSLIVSFTQILIFRPKVSFPTKASTDKYKNFDSEKKSTSVQMQNKQSKNDSDLN